MQVNIASLHYTYLNSGLEIYRVRQQKPDAHNFTSKKHLQIGLKLKK